MQFIPVNTVHGLRIHVAGCGALNQEKNHHQDSPLEFSDFAEYIEKYAAHVTDPNEFGLSIEEGIREVRRNFCTCAIKALKK